MELRLELPDELVALLGETPEAAASTARQAVVLDLLRHGHISQGTAAHLLGITRHDIIDLTAAYHIPSGPQTIEEFRDEVAAARRHLRTKHERFD
jgi:hypothetical protein